MGTTKKYAPEVRERAFTISSIIFHAELRMIDSRSISFRRMELYRP